jgi:endoglucanase Acf2
VGNPSYKDKYFPVVRQKDIYMGFSWATGIVPGTRQEESSSEVLSSVVEVMYECTLFLLNVREYRTGNQKGQST